MDQNLRLYIHYKALVPAAGQLSKVPAQLAAEGEQFSAEWAEQPIGAWSWDQGGSCPGLGPRHWLLLKWGDVTSSIGPPGHRHVAHSSLIFLV